MSVTLKPLGDRVLIRPEQAPTETASGLLLAPKWVPEQMGTVVAVGDMRHPRADEAEQLALMLVDEDSQNLVRALAGRPSAVAVGDCVVFSWQVGQELFINDGEDRLLMVRQSDLIAVVQQEGVPA